MKAVIIIVAIGIALYGIDILICKISPKAGFIVALFNLPLFPIGLVTFILTQNYLEKKLGVCNITKYFRNEAEGKKKKKTSLPVSVFEETTENKKDESLQKKCESKTGNSRIIPVPTSYETPYDDPFCDDNFNPDKYIYELRIARNGQEYYARIS